jgi:hypothetical protein
MIEIAKTVEKTNEIADTREGPQADKFKLSDTLKAPWENNDTTEVNKKDGKDNANDPFMISKSPEPPWKNEENGDLLKIDDTDNPIKPMPFDDTAIKPSGFIPRSDGKWGGNPGDSVWKPDRDKVPENPKTNPEGKTWGEILDKYGIKGIPFKDGEPDFSEVSKGTVEIDDFSEDRDDNFDAADEKLAEQRGCTKEEVRKWRQEHHYTWHERGDMKTMDKVPTEVHGNVPHEGGISAKKMENEHG